MGINRLAIFVTLVALLLAGCANVLPREQKGDTVVVSTTEPPTVEEPKVVEPLQQPHKRYSPPREPKLEVDFLKAGMSDATFMRTPEGKVIMINCGTLQTSKDVLQELQEEKVTKIDILFTTNALAENNGGCQVIQSSIEVVQKLDALQDIQRYQSTELLKHGPYRELGAQKFLELGSNVTIELIAPFSYDEGKRVDDNTLVVKITYDRNAILLLSSCDTACQRKVDPVRFDADVVQLASHGKLDDNPPKLLDAISPGIAIATAEFNNPRQLPNRELIKELNQRRIKLYRTDVQYNVMVTSNGRAITVDSEVPYKVEWG